MIVLILFPCHSEYLPIQIKASRLFVPKLSLDSWYYTICCTEYLPIQIIKASRTSVHNYIPMLRDTILCCTEYLPRRIHSGPVFFLETVALLHSSTAPVSPQVSCSSDRSLHSGKTLCKHPSAKTHMLIILYL